MELPPHGSRRRFILGLRQLMLEAGIVELRVDRLGPACNGYNADGKGVLTFTKVSANAKPEDNIGPFEQ